MRTKKTIYNFLVEGVFQILISLVGFVRIKCILVLLGDDILGAYQLFGQLLAYVSLAELGLTTAISFSLYKPIADKNVDKINSILSGTKKVFEKIMIVMLIIGIIITLNLNFLIKDTSISFIYLKICFFLMVISNIITYFVTPRALLFDSEHNKYIYARYTQLALFIKNILELFVLYIFKNILAIIIVSIFFSIIQNIIIYKISKKYHKYVDLNVIPDYSFWKKTKELIPHKIGMLISNNIDVIIISKTLGFLKVVRYTSYMYVINTITTVLGKISTASLPGIGNLLITDKDKDYARFLEYNSLVFFIATVVSLPLYFEISPFIQLCYGKKYLVNSFTCFLFVSIVFYGVIRHALNVFCNAAGLFKETLICVIIEITINILLSVSLIKHYDIAGVLLGTIVSYIVSEYMIKPHILNKYVFKRKNVFKYYFECVLCLIPVCFLGYIFRIINSYLKYSNLLIWFIYGLMYMIITFAITYIYYHFIGKDNFINRLLNIRRNNEKSKI